MFSNEIAERIEKAYHKRFITQFMPRGLAEAVGRSAGDEALCLKFLYAYMPASDLVSYDADLFTQIVRHTLEVRKQDIYGESVPDDIFFNYVLQCRVNDENLEFNRACFHGELYPRVRGLTAGQAVLEVNYWCLEKATYAGSNARTIAPFGLLKNTAGRCGEETVFTVSALRSVGIPARQIYVPRWAHCEDNHAWAEAYAGGRWLFLGACEPEPAPDKGWFPELASKTIIILARLFSDIPTPGEEAVEMTDISCNINRSSRYVRNPVKLKINVSNANGDVRVHIQIVSGCAFFTLTTLSPDLKGDVTVTIGPGDLHLHITDGRRLITRRVDARLEQNISVNFNDAREYEEGERSYVFAPPIGDYTNPDYGITRESEALHEMKTARCNEIRNAYARTFAEWAKGKTLAQLYGPDDSGGAEFFLKARGNLGEIVKFMNGPGNVKYKYMLLRSLEDKDLTDINAEVLTEHLTYALRYKNKYTEYDERIFGEYALCPRAEYEMITPYRAFIDGYFSPEYKKKFVDDPRAVWGWISDNVDGAPEYINNNNRQILTASPKGVLEYRRGGAHSRKLLFIAICRTLGIPARLHPHDGTCEYYKSGSFHNAASAADAPMFRVKVVEKSGRPLIYGDGFTLAALKDGEYETLLFNGRNDFYILARGYYRLIAGRRFSNGAMSVSISYADIDDDAEITVEIPSEKAPEYETIPLGDYNFGDIRLSELLTGKTLITCVKPSREPTEHLFDELFDAKADYMNKNVMLLVVTPEENDTICRLKAVYNGGVTVITVKDDSFALFLAEKTKLGGLDFPVVVMADSNREASYYIRGYNVGSAIMALNYIK